MSSRVDYWNWRVLSAKLMFHIREPPNLNKVLDNRVKQEEKSAAITHLAFTPTMGKESATRAGQVARNLYIQRHIVRAFLCSQLIIIYKNTF